MHASSPPSFAAAAPPVAAAVANSPPQAPWRTPRHGTTVARTPARARCHSHASSVAVSKELGSTSGGQERLRCERAWAADSEWDRSRSFECRSLLRWPGKLSRGCSTITCTLTSRLLHDGSHHDCSDKHTRLRSSSSNNSSGVEDELEPHSSQRSHRTRIHASRRCMHSPAVGVWRRQQQSCCGGAGWCRELAALLGVGSGQTKLVRRHGSCPLQRSCSNLHQHTRRMEFE
jgi:hypothetical protein